MYKKFGRPTGSLESRKLQASWDFLRLKKPKYKFYRQIIIYFLALWLFASIWTKLPFQSQMDQVNAAQTIALPLSTRGAKIVDAHGSAVLLRGVNWFGMETDLHAPHGLWKRDYKDMLAQIKSLGYNLIRLPFSVEAMQQINISGVDFLLGSNKELQDKMPILVMDAIVQEAERQGLLILLDCHGLKDNHIGELWYGDGFREADWINTWMKLASRYKSHPNVIGADLKNEPHGVASWGTNNPLTDWRLAAERVGNAILSVNRNWLIVVEGVEMNVPGQKLPIHWQGGNLEGVRRYPVRLSQMHKLVYSPHEYGPGVHHQPWFSSSTFPENLPNIWEKAFYYISREKIAPIFIGEFGGRRVDNSPEGIWQNQFVKFIASKKLSFAYWSWNPNSVDTGGILLDDWQSVDQPKQKMLSQLLKSPSLISTR